MQKLDTVTKEVNQAAKPKNDLTMVQSNLPGFRKQNEIVVLKNKVFRIQSISPKKLILKLIDTSKNTPDGIYCMQIVKPDKKPASIPNKNNPQLAQPDNARPETE